MTGDCVLTAVFNTELGCYEPRIDEAPPWTLISKDILVNAFFHEDPRFITVRRPIEGHGSTGHAVGDHDCWAPAGSVCFHGSIVTLHGTNRTVIYRVGRYNETHRAWEASWPD